MARNIVNSRRAPKLLPANRPLLTRIPPFLPQHPPDPPPTPRLLPITLLIPLLQPGTALTAGSVTASGIVQQKLLDPLLALILPLLLSSPLFPQTSGCPPACWTLSVDMEQSSPTTMPPAPSMLGPSSLATPSPAHTTINFHHLLATSATLIHNPLSLHLLPFHLPLLLPSLSNHILQTSFAAS